MALWRLYYHIVWATKDRLPLIVPEWEGPLNGYIIGKADHLETIVHAVGGMEDHLHLVASVPPKMALADVISQLKGASSHWLNDQRKGDVPFAWQRGYGVFSLGASRLANAVNYVHRQKEHHREGSTIRWLERAADEEDGAGAYDRGENDSDERGPENKSSGS